MSRRSVLTAFFAGGAFSVLLVPVTGFLAAIPSPGWHVGLARDHASLASLLSDTVLFVLPAGLLAFLFGLLLFRLLREASTRQVVACGAGWLVPGLVLDAVSMQVHAEDVLVAWGSLAMELGYWYRLAAVPIGLALAAFFFNRFNLPRQPSRSSLTPPVGGVSR